MLNKNRHAVPAADTLRPFLPFRIVLQFFSNYQLYLQETNLALEQKWIDVTTGFVNGYSRPMSHVIVQLMVSK